MKNIRMPIPSDKNQILSFCENTFSWGDYIHEVWESWEKDDGLVVIEEDNACLLYTSPSPRDGLLSRMPSSA